MIYNDINFKFFDQINTEEKAYCLGFLYADGCVSVKNSDYCLSLKLHKQDLSILEKIKNLLSTSVPIKVAREKYCYFRINRKEICQQLIHLGCVPKKSLILQFPTPDQVPQDLIHHFIRGYSDGDGCITSHQLKTGRKDFAWTIVSTNNFCQSLSQILKEKLSINCHIRTTDLSKKNTITETLSVGGSLQLAKVLDWMYQDSTIHMERKYQKYLAFKSQINNNPLQQKFSERGGFKLDQKLAISLYLNGNSKRKVAKIMNCDTKAIYNILKKNCIKTINEISYHKENSISNKGDEIVLLYNKGMSIKDIAKKFNCTTNNITIILNKNNVKIISKNNKKNLSQEEVEKILLLRREGLGCSRIGKEMGLTKSFISRFLRKKEC